MHPSSASAAQTSSHELNPRRAAALHERRCSLQRDGQDGEGGEGTGEKEEEAEEEVVGAGLQRARHSSFSNSHNSKLSSISVRQRSWHVGWLDMEREEGKRKREERVGCKEEDALIIPFSAFFFAQFATSTPV